jgi:hypothetical protein
MPQMAFELFAEARSQARFELAWAVARLKNLKEAMARRQHIDISPKWRILHQTLADGHQITGVLVTLI